MNEKITIPQKLKYMKEFYKEMLQVEEKLLCDELMEKFDEILYQKFELKADLGFNTMMACLKYSSRLNTRNHTKKTINEAFESVVSIGYMVDKVLDEIIKLQKQRQKQTKDILKYLVFMDMFNKNVISKYKN